MADVARRTSSLCAASAQRAACGIGAQIGDHSVRERRQADPLIDWRQRSCAPAIWRNLHLLQERSIDLIDPAAAVGGFTGQYPHIFLLDFFDDGNTLQVANDTQQEIALFLGSNGTNIVSPQTIDPTLPAGLFEVPIVPPLTGGSELHILIGVAPRRLKHLLLPDGCAPKLTRRAPV